MMAIGWFAKADMYYHFAPNPTDAGRSREMSSGDAVVITARRVHVQRLSSGT